MMKMPEAILQHYNAGNESHRLSELSLERLRTESILRRYLPKSPKVIFDIGGADGVYAFPLAEKGYEVHLIDPVTLHIEQAQQKNKSVSKKLKTISVGDARELSAQDNVADVILYLGPLYHLIDVKDRQRAISEAFRILKPGGIFIAAFISKFTSMIDGVRADYFADQSFVDIVKQDLKNGPHANPSNHPGYFTDAFFHHPDDAIKEVKSGGFQNLQCLSVEGPLWMISGLQNQLVDEDKRSQILAFLEQTESESTLVGASGHFIVIGYK
jgi:ubiquinone/menaquinone biosynthesis C-methylase UbiE